MTIKPAFQTVNEFDTAEFKCDAFGGLAPRVEWYRKNGIMNSNTDILTGGVLRISNATLKNEAEYYCTATNDAGTTGVRTILYVTNSKLVKI